jgi:hypothetical protein
MSVISRRLADWYRRRHPPPVQNRRALERMSDYERSQVVILGLGTSVVVLSSFSIANGLLFASVVRVWRRRHAGVVRAFRDGVLWRPLLVLAVSSSTVRWPIRRKAIRMGEIASSRPTPDNSEDRRN